MNRQEVYKIIDSERDYQNRWDKAREGTDELMDRDKPVECWILWMEEYLKEARKNATQSISKKQAMNSIRKVTALGIAAMEYLGAERRLMPEEVSAVKKQEELENLPGYPG